MTSYEKILLLLVEANKAPVPNETKQFIEFILNDPNMILGWMVMNSILFGICPELLELSKEIGENALIWAKYENISSN